MKTTVFECSQKVFKLIDSQFSRLTLTLIHVNHCRLLVNYGALIKCQDIAFRGHLSSYCYIFLYKTLYIVIIIEELIQTLCK